MSYRSLKTLAFSICLAICLVVFFAGFLAGRCHGADSGADRYTAAYRQWQASDKPLVIWYTAEWCQPCQAAARQYAAEVAAGAIVVTLDVDRDRDLIARARLPRPAAVPALVCYPPRGAALYRWHPRWLDPRHPIWPRIFIGVPGIRIFIGR